MGGVRAVVLRPGARGLVAAMAMSGMRTVTAGAAQEEQAPPEAIVSEHAPGAVQRLSERQRAAVTELMHWGYGAGGGILFALLSETFGVAAESASRTAWRSGPCSKR